MPGGGRECGEQANSLFTAAWAMASWDLAERVIDASSPSCRENLQHALEHSSAGLSTVCRAEVGTVLQEYAGKSRPRPEATQNGERDESRASHDDQSNADGTVTIVLTFVSCVLAAVAAFAYYVGGGRAMGGRPMRGGRRLPKKKHERTRERGKKRR